MFHRWIYGHKYEPNVIGYDKYYFDVVDGCKKCKEKEQEDGKEELSD